MKKILFTLLILFAFFTGYPQMVNNGGAVTVESGATLVIEGNYTSTASATIQVDGNVQLKGDFINNGGSIAPASIGTLTMNGTVAQNIGGSVLTNFYCSLEVDNTLGVSLNGANEVLSNALILTDGKLTLNAYDLTLAAVGVTGASPASYVVTNAAGQLKAPVVNSNYLFPVGTSTSYRPLILNEAGSADTYGVKFLTGLPSGWTGGTAHTVGGHWAVTEVAPGGNTLTATAQWNGSDETSFDRTDCAVGVTTDNGATVAWQPSGAAIGSNPYTRSGAGFTSIGTFMVADYFFEGIDLNLNAFLAGPYSTGTMSTALKTAGLVPLSDPYANTAAIASVPANTIDWIEVQLRDSNTPTTILKKYSFMLRNDGTIMSTTGTAGTKLTGITKGSYYVALHHRNHLGVMTASPIDFTAAGPLTFDFTAGVGIYGTNAMKNISGVYAMWSGDADGNGIIEYARPTSDITPISSAVLNDSGNPSHFTNYAVTNVYSTADVDMNGIIEYARPTSDITPISSSVLNYPGNPSHFTNYAVTQQLP